MVSPIKKEPAALSNQGEKGDSPQIPDRMPNVSFSTQQNFTSHAAQKQPLNLHLKKCPVTKPFGKFLVQRSSISSP